jgi:DNA-directed RNA polymerase subunit RPC12/RpoP
MIKYKCDKCGSTLTIKDELAGTAGKCPKCKTKFRVPEPAAAGSPGKSPPRTKGKARSDENQKDLTEEDMIFGEDFFNSEEAPKRPRHTLPVPGDDESSKPKKKKQPFGAANPTGDNSANIASELLSKTGKKNRPSDVEVEEEVAGGYDFSAITYLILWRVIPVVVAFCVLVPAFYWVFADMIRSTVEIPPLVEIHGVLSIDGSPLPNAEILFIPALDEDVPASGGLSRALTGPDGSFVAYYTADVPGVVLGKNIVRIRAPGRLFQHEITVAEGDTEKNIALSSSK